jgi:glutathionylspermidine synthase
MFPRRRAADSVQAQVRLAALRNGVGMRRNASLPRDNWREKVEAKGLVFHTAGENVYWNESAYYEFTSVEIDKIEKATYELNDLCLAAVEYAVKKDYLERMGIPLIFVEWVKRSWEKDEHTVVGRFDLAVRQDGSIKLLEYNADTPTSLLEAAVIQWFWMKEVFPSRDQFNNIHETLIEAWKSLRSSHGARWHFASVSPDDSPEDFMTASYLRDTAMQAGLDTQSIAMVDIGFDQARRQFVDAGGMPLQNCFKLYPWEWMLREKFGPMLISAPTRWLEAPWKMLLSNKAILAVLWELFPGHENLLETSFERIAGDHVKKPLFSREGANVEIVRNGQVVISTPGEYGDGPHVYQRFCELPRYGEHFPVVGSWMINGHACGIGIREDRTLVTGNLSRFVPHIF